MSADADRAADAAVAEWSRLERAVEDATVALGRWSRRSRESEEEVLRLRRSLEELAARTNVNDLAQEVARLRAENAALRSRMLQARKRIGGLMQRLATLELDS